MGQDGRNVTVTVTESLSLMDILPNITFPDQFSGAYVRSNAGFEAFRIDPGLEYIKQALAAATQTQVYPSDFVGPLARGSVRAPTGTTVCPSVSFKITGIRPRSSTRHHFYYPAA